MNPNYPPPHIPNAGYEHGNNDHEPTEHSKALAKSRAPSYAILPQAVSDLEEDVYVNIDRYEADFGLKDVTCI